MGIFDLFKKKEKHSGTNYSQEQSFVTKNMLCPRCGHTYPMNTVTCKYCNTTLYVEGENFCTNQDCERFLDRYPFSHDDFYCDKCNKPTIVELLSREYKDYS